MFDIGWTEILLIAVVAIIVVGPKDLPGMLRTIGQMIKKVRGMAGDFQRQFDDALKDAELDGIKDAVNDVRSLNQMNSLKDKLNPLKDSVNSIEKDIKGKFDYDPDELFDDDPGMVSEDPVKVDVEAALKREAEKSKFTGTDAIAKPAKRAAKKNSSKASPKKITPKKQASKKSAAKKLPTKKPAIKKVAAKKPAANSTKATAKKPGTKPAVKAATSKKAKTPKPAARKTVTKKTSTKKTTAKKTAAKTTNKGAA